MNADLQARLDRIDPAKIKAYREHRTVSRTNPFTKYYFEYHLWDKCSGPPFWPEPPKASEFCWPKKYDEAALSYGSTYTWEEDGFKLVASIKADDHCDSDYLGVYQENSAHATYPPSRLKGDAIGMDYYEYDGEWIPRYWYVPEYNPLDEIKSYKTHLGKQRARLSAMNALRWNFRRLRGFGDDWYNVGVVVKAFKNGVELGDASLWGLESDAGPYLVEVAHDVAYEAIQEAKITLQHLVTSKAEEEGKILKTHIVEGLNQTFWVQSFHRGLKNGYEQFFQFHRHCVYYVTLMKRLPPVREGGVERVHVLVATITDPYATSVVRMDMTLPDFNKIIEHVIKEREEADDC